MTMLQQSVIAQSIASGYQISRSLRFNAPDGAYLTRTLGTPTSANTWTVSFWLKRANITFSQYEYIWSYDSSARGIAIDYSGGTNPDCLYVYNGTTSSYGTLQRLRDPGAWDHFVASCNAGTVSVYRTGASTPYITATGMPSMASGMVMQIGRLSSSGLLPLNAYLADFRFIDGQALTPSSFGEFDANTGVWVPKAYTGTYGTNGFWLKFDDNSGVTATTLGKDSSGNGNNWTPNNFSVTAGAGNDSLVDTPTNYGTDTGAGGEVRGNYATWNPLDNNTTLSNGNLAVSAGTNQGVTATFAFPSGSWYWETIVNTVAANTQVGIIAISQASSVRTLGTAGIRLMAQSNGTILLDGTSPQTGLTSWSNGDVIGCAFNATTNSMQFYRNGSTYGTAVTATSGYVYVPFCGSTGNTASFDSNFGQRPFSYSAPSGFKALCTQNLPTPAIGASASTLASKNFDVALHTGNGGTTTVSSLNFQPDLVWIKARSNAANHGIIDSVRGIANQLSSSSTAAEISDPAAMQSFNSNGFTVANSATGYSLNTNAYTYADWCWKAGGAAVTNTAGSITSTVSANTAAGIAIVGWTGTGANGTIGHGLGKAPSLILIKSRSAGSTNWNSYHAAIGAGSTIVLNLTIASTAGSQFFNNTAPTSSVFSVGTDGSINPSGQTQIAYCFAEVAGFSKFGSYTGNGSTDGPFVYCGFRPRFIMIKRTDSTSGWSMIDTARDTYNYADKELFANLSNAEASAGASYSQDVLSNGFKIRRASDSSFNASGGTYIFAAFAEAPFNYARAR